MSEPGSNKADRARWAGLIRLPCLALCFAVLTTAALTTAALTTAALAADGPTTLDQFDFYGKLFGTLIGALVVATILESALSVLFNWRIYTIVFNGRAWKTVFMVIGAWIIVGGLQYDIVAKILSQVDVEAQTDEAVPAAPPVTTASPPDAPATAVATAAEERNNFGTALLSVLFLAGGSSGVHNLLRQFGFRSPLQDAPEEKLDETEAWVSITVVRDKAKGPVVVHFEEIEPEPGDTYMPVAAVLDDTHVLRRAWLTMWARPMRYPNYGGRTVRTNRIYRIRVSGEGITDSNNEVFEGRFASRAVVDLVKTV